MSIEANRACRTVERMCSGERVLSGPFETNHVNLSIRRSERSMAVKALRTQTDHGHPARLVTHQGRAFVLRPEEGMTKMGKNGALIPITPKTQGGVA